MKMSALISKLKPHNHDKNQRALIEFGPTPYIAVAVGFGDGLA